MKICEFITLETSYAYYMFRPPLPDNTQQSQTTDIHSPGPIRTRNLSKRADADPCLRSRGHWDRPFWYLVDTKYISGLSFTAPLCDSSSAVCESPNSASERRIRSAILLCTNVRVVRNSKVRKSRTACTLKNQSWSADKEWSSRLGVGGRASNSLS
jgi:hypothetical protein